MDDRAWLARYAAWGVMVIGGIEWLLGRVVSRFAAIPPLEGIGRTIVETLGRAGLFLISTAFLVAAALYFATTLGFGERANRRRNVGDLALALYLTLFGVFLAVHALFTVFSIFGEEAWLNAAFNILSLVAVWWLTLRFVLTKYEASSRDNVRTSYFVLRTAKLGVLLVALAYSGWYFAVLSSWVAGSGTIGESGPADALRLGELAAVLAPIAFFVGIAIPGGEWRKPKRWIVPLIAFLIFSAGNIADIIANQGYTGVFAIWSVGFTLWLPWPLYALSLTLFLYAFLTCFAHERALSHYANRNSALGLLLLFFAGFYLQLTYQHLLAVLAVLLLTGIARPFAAVGVPALADTSENSHAAKFTT